MARSTIGIALVTVAALLAGGCGQGAQALLQTAAVSLSPSASVHPEPTVEVYSRVARGALACWFGSSGSLKRTHVFHADVAPESKGGDVEIVLHERDQAAQSPRALRAFRISIVRSGSGSRMVSENLRLPEAVGRDLQADIRRWAAGETGCQVVGTGGWTAVGGPGREPDPLRAEPVKAVRKKN